MSECPACGGYDPITFDEADLVADFIESNMPIVPARLRWVLEQMTRRFADAYRYGGVVGQDYLGTSRKNADALSAAHVRIAELERAGDAVADVLRSNNLMARGEALCLASIVYLCQEEIKEEPTMKNTDIAQICHEANRAYCKTLGDFSQPSWEDAPEWQKTSAINGVNFHLDNPNAAPSHSHEQWLAEKVATGWKYGPVKDADKKEHPCCVPYEQLPAAQQRKDLLFKAVVDACR